MTTTADHGRNKTFEIKYENDYKRFYEDSNKPFVNCKVDKTLIY